MQKLVRDMGLRSDIYLIAAAKEVTVSTKPFTTYGRGGSRWHRGDLLLLQASTGSPIGHFLLRRTEPLIVNYHNITPSSDFEAWDMQIAREMDKGREELRALAHRTLHAIADSSYNEAELKQYGYLSTSVTPILFDVSTFDHPADRRIEEWLRRERARGGTNILFVGRVVPNKAHHDLISAFAAYRRLFDPDSRLYIVGGCPVPDYQRALRRLTAELDVEDAVDFSGFVTPGELTAYYQAADVFVCLSDHEGFCVPLLEAMYHRVPIIGFNAAAVPETLGSGGLLLSSKDPLTVAVAVKRVIADEKLGEALVAAGALRLSSFSLELSRESFRRGLEKAIAMLGESG